MKRSMILMALMLMVTAPASSARADAHGAALNGALRSEYRTTDEKARDVYRHPRETLEFFGIEPDMTIVELAPGGGWYTNILAPLVRDEGTYIGVESDPEIYATDFPDAAKRLIKYPEMVKADPAKYGAKGRGTWILKGDIAPTNSVDMVLGFRFLHGWVSRGHADEALSKLNAVLKPGGVFAIVQHRAKESDPRDAAAIAETGYVKQSYVIELMKKHGFELADSREINANPKDRKDHPQGVWTLPPTLALGDEDKQKYLAVGESDRMTLKFVKAK